MKKLLLSVLAITGLVACTKSDVIEMPQNQAIKFGSAFVDNSTKAIDPSWNYTAENASFKVWGKLQPAGDNTVSTNIFNGVDVKKTSNDNTDIGTANQTWFYEDDYVQYWIPTVQYNFAAIAGTIASSGVTMSDNLPATIPYDVTTQSDLLYASAEATGVASNNSTVAFTFSHLLSKVKFEFVNEYPAVSNLFIKVSDIEIVNPYKTATYTISSSTWGSQVLGTDYTQQFGNAVASDVTVAEAQNRTAVYIAPSPVATTALASDEKASGVSEYARLLIPGTYDATKTNKLQISFVATVYLRQGEGTAESPYTYTEINYLKVDKSTDYVIPTSLTLANNYSYNFKITLGDELEPIKFNVSSVTGWSDGEAITDTDDNNDTEIPLVNN